MVRAYTTTRDDTTFGLTSSRQLVACHVVAATSDRWSIKKSMELAYRRSLLNELELLSLLSILPLQDFILVDVERDVFGTGILTCHFSRHWILLALCTLKRLAVPVWNVVGTSSSTGACPNGFDGFGCNATSPHPLAISSARAFVV